MLRTQYNAHMQKHAFTAIRIIINNTEMSDSLTSLSAKHMNIRICLAANNTIIF